MKSVKELTVKVLEVQSKDLFEDPEEGPRVCEWEALEFSNGMIVVPCSGTNDLYYDSRQYVEPHGQAEILGIEDTGETRVWTSEELLYSVQGAIREFGEDAVTTKLWRELVKGC